jgi:menaquinone-dependent protoporphyrinogen oxidase
MVDVLVAYAGRSGSTEGIAGRIADRLGAAGHRVHLSRVEQVTDLRAFGAVVVGSPVFNQRWMPEVEEFVRRDGSALAERPVWVFTVASFGDSKPLIGSMMKRQPRGIDRIAETIHPRGYRVFAGVIHRNQWPFFSRVFFHALGGRLGDNRDWPAIDAWADEIAHDLAAAGG